MRARLDETNALTDDQAARLVAAMREERDRYLSERAVGSGVYQSTYPFTLYSLDADPATQVTSGESQIKATQAFLGRIHDRAAALLTDEQLRRFAELQDKWSNLASPLFYGEVGFDQGMKATQDACQAIMDLPRP